MRYDVTMEEIPSRQEMFDRAFRGLRAQGFERCAANHYGCLYEDLNTGRRCAWGHVDASLTGADSGSVWHLRREKIGLAARIPLNDVDFAMALQRAHDNAMGPGNMEELLRNVAERFGLTVPD